MLFFINGVVREININNFITDSEYYKYIMQEMKKKR